MKKMNFAWMVFNGVENRQMVPFFWATDETANGSQNRNLVETISTIKW